MPRPTCYTCFRPETLCVCGLLQPLPNRTRISIVQHPRERLHPLNTARIAEGSLRNVNVLRGSISGLVQQLESGIIDSGAMLLFPAPHATTLENLPPERRPTEIVVVDGTWHHAKVLLRDIPFLRTLSCVRFTPPKPSEYRIRREPRPEYLSTIESIAHVLSVLEPELDGLDSLGSVFREMIDRNLAARSVVPTGRYVRRRTRGYTFPDSLLAPAANVVLAYCEGASLPSTIQRKHPLVAFLQKANTGEQLKLILRTPTVPRLRLLEELGLTHAQLTHAAVDSHTAQEQIARFLQDALVVGWNGSTLGILSELGSSPRQSLLLKGTYCDWRRSLGEHPSSWGGMDEILSLRGVRWVAPTGGRGERRLAQTAALWSFLRARAADELVPSQT